MSIYPLATVILTINIVANATIASSLALPPPEDISEEILRTEIILEGRSPLDGKPLTAAEYEQLQADLAQSAFAPQLGSDIQQLIFLLQIRKLFKTIIPFF